MSFPSWLAVIDNIFTSQHIRTTRHVHATRSAVQRPVFGPQPTGPDPKLLHGGRALVVQRRQRKRTLGPVLPGAAGRRAGTGAAVQVCDDAICQVAGPGHLAGVVKFAGTGHGRCQLVMGTVGFVSGRRPQD